MSSDAYAAHILTRLQADVHFLESTGHLTPEASAAIRSHLSQPQPTSSTSTPAAILPNLTSRFAQLAKSKRSAPAVPQPAVAAAAPEPEPQTQQDLARAIWSYTAEPGASDELSFAEGDTLVVVERTSADWWKGYVLSRPSEPKLYPANYVESIAVAPTPPSRSLPPAYAGSGSYSEKSEGATYTASGRLIPKARFSSGGPPPPPAQGDQQQAQAGPSNGNGIGGLTPVMTEEQKAKKNAGMKKLGGTMAHGAAGGVGFGVGMGLVNAIF
ncbi:hypothetical protein OC861_006078 [Tilletia horrida]|nr:hypothetical protein OC861_006078 [Tilletia horrida]